MSNMSYCRFTNTRTDLGDCLDAIQNDKCLSRVEANAGVSMFKDFLDFCQTYGIIDTFDCDRVDKLFCDLLEREDDEE